MSDLDNIQCEDFENVYEMEEQIKALQQELAKQELREEDRSVKAASLRNELLEYGLDPDNLDKSLEVINETLVQLTSDFNEKLKDLKEELSGSGSTEPKN
jgi:chromosome segregation ATPase